MNSSNQPWWNDNNDIGQTENEEYGVNSIHARKVKGDWEYACVWWRYSVPTLQWRMKGGKIIEGNLDD